MRRLVILLALLAALITAFVPAFSPDGARPGELSSALAPQGLPPEAIETLTLILSDGPFPHRQDGTVFQNRERLLPDQPRGYYREYTVRTPGASNRGARRIVTGGDPPEVFYYTRDHYRSFTRFEPPR